MPVDEKMPKALSPEDKRPILSIADALEWAADILSSRANNQGLMSLIGGVLEKRELDAPDIPEVVREAMKTSMIEPEKQVSYLRETSRILRELAVEHRVLAMRELDALREKADGHAR